MSNQQKFRSFFAIDLSDDVHYETIKLIKYLKKQKHYQHIKWTKSENLHITMRFLGNISVEQYERIIIQVSEKIKDIKPFSISFTSLIVFPSPEKPVAVALKPDPLAALIKLNQMIENGVTNCDVKPESRAFLPHLTLGKIKSRRASKLPEIELPKMELEVKKITLFKSNPGAGGSVYIPLVCLPLS